MAHSGAGLLFGSNMTEDEKILMRNLMEGWLTALHNVDTYFQVVQEIPAFQAKFDLWKCDPVRMESTESRFEPIRTIVEGVLAGDSASSLVLQSVAIFDKKPN